MTKAESAAGKDTDMYRDNYRMSLAQWMKQNNLPHVSDADQIFLGQAITSEEAVRVRRMLMRAYLTAEGMEVLSETTEFKYPCNMAFLGWFLKLFADGSTVYCDPQWQEHLCYTLTSDDRHAMQTMLEKNNRNSRRRKTH